MGTGIGESTEWIDGMNTEYGWVCCASGKTWRIWRVMGLNKWVKGGSR